MSELLLVAGLGNIGSEYDRTRHNVGFDVIDLLAEKLGTDVKSKKFSAFFGQAEFEDKKLILIKPMLYMNRSGQVIATVAGFYKIPPQDVLVVTDDMALEPGIIRLRTSGSAGGHNGLTDIISKLGGDNFNRLRIGIGKPDRMISKDYVLSKPSLADRTLINRAEERAWQAVLSWASKGPAATMNKFNVKNSESGQ